MYYPKRNNQSRHQKTYKSPQNYKQSKTYYTRNIIHTFLGLRTKTSCREPHFTFKIQQTLQKSQNLKDLLINNPSSTPNKHQFTTNKPKSPTHFFPSTLTHHISNPTQIKILPFHQFHQFHKLNHSQSTETGLTTKHNRLQLHKLLQILSSTHKPQNLQITTTSNNKPPHISPPHRKHIPTNKNHRSHLKHSKASFFTRLKQNPIQKPTQNAKKNLDVHL